MQLAPNHIKFREIKLLMMVLKYVHNSMTILPQKANSPPPEYRLTWVTHLLTNGMWPQWCQTTSKVRWEKVIQSPRGSLPFGTQDFRTLSQQHIRSPATQRPPFWRDHGKDYMEIERDVWTAPAVCPPAQGSDMWVTDTSGDSSSPGFWVTASELKWTQMSCPCWAMPRLQVKTKYMLLLF